MGMKDFLQLDLRLAIQSSSISWTGTLRHPGVVYDGHYGECVDLEKMAGCCWTSCFVCLGSCF